LVHDVADRIDEIVMNPVNMERWRNRVKQTLDPRGGIRTSNDLLDRLLESVQDKDVGLYYTVLAFCHDDFDRSTMYPILTKEIKALNPKMCTYPEICVYQVRGIDRSLNKYLRYVEKDLGKFAGDLGEEGETRNSKPGETGRDVGPGVFGWIKGWLWKLYEKTLKVVVEAILERYWPKSS
jgi:hypothetical protein